MDKEVISTMPLPKYCGWEPYTDIQWQLNKRLAKLMQSLKSLSLMAGIGNIFKNYVAIGPIFLEIRL